MPRPKLSNKRDDLVFARMKPDDAKRIRQAAEKEGISLSAIVRRAVMRDLRRLEALEAVEAHLA